MFSNDNIWIWIQISLKLAPNGPIDNMSALVQTMVQHWTGDRLLPEPMINEFPNVSCIAWPWWVNEYVSQTDFFYVMQFIIIY